jgi:hypothetical protein
MLADASAWMGGKPMGFLRHGLRKLYQYWFPGWPRHRHIKFK